MERFQLWALTLHSWFTFLGWDSGVNLKNNAQLWLQAGCHITHEYFYSLVCEYKVIYRTIPTVNFSYFYLQVKSNVKKVAAKSVWTASSQLAFLMVHVPLPKFCFLFQTGISYRFAKVFEEFTAQRWSFPLRISLVNPSKYLYFSPNVLVMFM